MYSASFEWLFTTLTTIWCLSCLVKQTDCQQLNWPKDVVLIQPQVWNGKQSSPIIKGVISEPHKWPWMVFLKIEGNRQCGGCLISQEWVLTAAHCMERYAVEEIILGSNYIDGSDPNAITRKVDRKCCHESYDRNSFESDICLIKLSSPVTFNDNLKSIDLPRSRSQMTDNSLCTVLGWGLNEKQQILPGLQEANVTVINLRQCIEWYAEDRVQIPKSHFCAGHAAGGRDTCAGDSGGPLVHQKNGKYILRGITSFGSNTCGAPKRPGVYTRVSRFISWIRRKMNQPSCTASKAAWSEWTNTCFVTCGSGIEIKRRKCLNDKGRSVSTNLCPGRFVEYGSCNEKPCNGQAYHWGPWETKCSVTCGSGIQTQTRKCLDENDDIVSDTSLCSPGSDNNIGRCVLPVCPAFSWGTWNAGQCSVTCGNGTLSRSRNCLDSKNKSVDASNCVGDEEDQTECIMEPCKSYTWGPWDTKCSVTCGTGVRTRTRKCLDEEQTIATQISLCSPGKEKETGTCVLSPCPTYQWGPWSEVCSVTCSTGIRTRTRKCLNQDNDVSETSLCKPGSDEDTGICDLPACTTYSWSPWTSQCSVTCGNGTETRTRECKDSNDTVVSPTKCKGISEETGRCNLQPCPTWSKWTSKCFVTCGNGIEIKTRVCFNEKNQTISASQCAGRSVEYGSCNEKPCEDYSWGEWKTECNVTCGTGVETRTRQCKNFANETAPVSECEGDSTMTTLCTLPPCETYHWGPWDTKCSVTCGKGTQLRARQCLDQDEDVVFPPSPCLPGEVEDNGICELPECLTFSWTPWTTQFSVTCGNGTETRTRKCIDSSSNDVPASNCKGDANKTGECSLPPCMTYHWGPWDEKCSVTCGKGVQLRTRGCLDQDDKVVFPPTPCMPGEVEDTGECKLDPCPTFSWTPWVTQCSVTCGNGTETRTRKCIDSLNKNAPVSKCSGDANATGTCTLASCANYHWGSWDEKCSVTCGKGVSLRTRKCLDQDDKVVFPPTPCMPGEVEDTGECELDPCQRYSWSEWKTRCSVTCGKGIETKSRTCVDSDNKTVSFSRCKGHRTRKRICTQPACKEYHWGAWDVKCSVTCGIGVETRSRKCLDESDKIVNDASLCPPGKDRETGKCDLSPCPVYKWGPWKTQCSVTCGDGVERKTRQCMDSKKNVVSANKCTGKFEEKGNCSVTCITYSWSSWEAECSVTCGKGIETRTRKCIDSNDKIAPLSQCQGRSRRWTTCALPPCKYYSWGPWNTECSVTCGTGVRTKTRKCFDENKKEMDQTSLCSPGKDKEIDECTLPKCETYNWGEWTKRCSVTCGLGIETRTRKCLNSNRKIVDTQKCTGRSITRQRCRLSACQSFRWGEWKSKCSVTCGDGIEKRTRNCLNSNNQIVSTSNCKGKSTEQSACTKDDCITYKWGPWKTECSVTCGSGIEISRRDCIDSSGDRAHRSLCARGSSILRRSCILPACKPKYRWGSWKTECSVTCGTGIETKTRKCLDNRNKEVVASNCNGRSTERVACNRPACQTFKWGPWKSDCSVTCGRGIDSGRRECLDSRGRVVNSARCKPGSDRMRGTCNPGACKRIWSSKPDYQWEIVDTSCSVTCGNGQELTVRKCTNRAGDKVQTRHCSGSQYEIGTCSLPPCVVSSKTLGGYVWDPWTSWSRCRVGSSGKKFRSATRYCMKNNQDVPPHLCKNTIGGDNYKEEFC